MGIYSAAELAAIEQSRWFNSCKISQQPFETFQTIIFLL